MNVVQQNCQGKEHNTAFCVTQLSSGLRYHTGDPNSGTLPFTLGTHIAFKIYVTCFSSLTADICSTKISNKKTFLEISLIFHIIPPVKH